MKRLLISSMVGIVSLSVFATQSFAGFYDATGRHRGVPEFRADMQACLVTWEAMHPHRGVAIHPHPTTAAPSANHQGARYSYIMYTCLPGRGWRPTSS